MLFLTGREIEAWNRWGREAVEGSLAPGEVPPGVRAPLRPVFCFFAGTMLTARGQRDAGRGWLLAGTREETAGLMTNALVTAFLERHGGRLVKPAVVFADPAPYLHFIGVPPMQRAREQFRAFAARSLPRFDHPLHFLDIGCGDGDLTVTVLRRLQMEGNAASVGEVALVDSSKAMLDMAEGKVREAFPGCSVRTFHDRIQNVAGQVGEGYDVAVCSLSYHHMPRETKLAHLGELSGRLDHLLLFELGADNDTPEMHSPELAMAVYQSYGRIIDFIFAHDTDIRTAQESVDCFLMVEAVSFLTQPRGERSDYHMLRGQWHEAFQMGLGPAYRCLGDTTCHADEHLDLFALHYGRG
ncbi:MAG: class I SAM-dependent methyltransferase [Acidobacteria bacterium]|nr:class I SAM-dependent methyltransferase [Acidobacteriota bacterium]